MRTIVETAVRSDRALHRVIEVVGSSVVLHFVRLLCLVPGASQVTVERLRRHFIAEYGEDGRGADVVAPPLWMSGREDDGASTDFRLVNGRYRLWPMRQFGADPIELRGVHCWHVNHGDADATVVMQQLRPKRLREAHHGVLRPAVRRLERYAAIGQRASHLDNGSAVSREHHIESRFGPVDES
jgi:hypothetical protein